MFNLQQSACPAHLVYVLQSVQGEAFKSMMLDSFMNNRVLWQLSIPSTRDSEDCEDYFKLIDIQICRFLKML